MHHIRTTKTASNSTAVQIVKYVDRRMIIVNHVGSAHTVSDIETLKNIATDWIEKNTKQSSLFALDSKKSSQTILDQFEYVGVHFSFIYEVLHKILDRFKFFSFDNIILNDLVIMRLFEPASKLRSFELLQEYFGISHRRQTFYEELQKLVKLKNSVEKLVTKIAIEEFGFDFSLVFYDVTTLYFESFKADELRKNGFSKDCKSNQPQIVIGLMVNKFGFPVTYEIFEGNKFEGHTMIPVIQEFQKKHNIKTLTVVADSAMLSFDNIKALKKANLSYIVGARIANQPISKIKEVSSVLNQKDSTSIRTETKHGTLICDFSTKRYRKDKNEMEKQIKKAEAYLKKPSEMKRTKFLKNLDKGKYVLNAALKEKTELLLGIKGYCTNLNLEVSNQEVVNHYHQLWHVEQAFRIAKNDLQTRPIYHFKQDAVKTHILICFMALAVSKYIELKTGMSIKATISSLKRVTDAKMRNTMTNEEHIMRTKLPENIIAILQKLGLSY